MKITIPGRFVWAVAFFIAFMFLCRGISRNAEADKKYGIKPYNPKTDRSLVGRKYRYFHKHGKWPSASFH